MAIFTDEERRFAEAARGLLRVNPFLPARLDLERAALGPEFVEEGADTSVHPLWEAQHPNSVRLAAKGLQRRDDAPATRYRYQTRFALSLRSREALMRLQQRLAELGIDGLDQVQPLSQRLPEYADQARRLALQDAQRKAETLAAAAGWRLLGPVAVRIEDDRPWWTPQPPTARQYGARAYNYAADAPVRGSETTAQVEVEYAYAR